MSAEPLYEMLSLSDWTHPADEQDCAMLGLCLGPTLDVGCGPGRLTERLAALGHVVLGIDVLRDAVGQTRERGASAIHRDVFEPLPGEGRWRTALLADGNIGIGGDPVALLRRLRELLDPRGRIVAELAAPGTPLQHGWATVSSGGWESSPFRWSVVGIDDIDDLAARAGLEVVSFHELDGRWCGVLEELR
jgi:SAM-dependent methyltransferase